MCEWNLRVEDIAGILDVTVERARNLISGRVALYYPDADRIARYFRLHPRDLFENRYTFTNYNAYYQPPRRRHSKYRHYPNLFRVMCSRGMCADDVAKILNINTASARDLLSGNRKLLWTEAVQLADYFCEDVQNLFTPDAETGCSEAV